MYMYPSIIYLCMHVPAWSDCIAPNVSIHYYIQYMYNIITCHMYATIQLYTVLLYNSFIFSYIDTIKHMHAYSNLNEFFSKIRVVIKVLYSALNYGTIIIFIMHDNLYPVA